VRVADRSPTVDQARWLGVDASPRSDTIAPWPGRAYLMRTADTSRDREVQRPNQAAQRGGHPVGSGPRRHADDERPVVRGEGRACGRRCSGLRPRCEWVGLLRRRRRRCGSRHRSNGLSGRRGRRRRCLLGRRRRCCSGDGRHALGLRGRGRRRHRRRDACGLDRGRQGCGRGLGRSRARRQERQRVDVAMLVGGDADAEVDMWRLGDAVTALPHLPDRRALTDGRTLLE
jgi:hypothetical protein